MLKSIPFGALLGAVISAISPTIAAAETPDITRLPIQGVTLVSNESLPESVVLEEQRSRTFAVDRNTETGLTLFDQGDLTVAFDGSQNIEEMRIFGAAPFAVNVFADSQAQSILSHDLSQLSEGWNTLIFTTPIDAAELRLELVPVAASDAVALQEIEFWGQGDRSSLTVAQASTLLESDEAVGPWRGFAAMADDQIVELNQDASVAMLQFDLPVLPTEVRTAWVEYEVRGDVALTALGRAFNSYPFVGGYPFAPSEDWVAQRERIDPTQLMQGSNALTLAISETTGYLDVRGMRIVVELADGVKVQPAEGQGALFDADLNTALTVPSGGSSVELVLAKTSSVDALALTFSSATTGTVSLEQFADDAWMQVGAAVDLSGAISGESVLLDASGAQTDTLRLAFSGVTLPFGISELSVKGSEVGTTWGTPSLNVVWPVAGENYGSVGLVRGFVSQPELEEGTAQVFVAGLPVQMANGTFEAIVSREQAGFGSSDLSEPWAVEVKLVSGDGSETITSVPFAASGDGIGDDSYFPEPTVDLVTASEAALLSNGGAELEIGAASVEQDTAISITPLLEAELARMDLGLTNVTRGQGKGFRMLPHMKFKKKIKIKLDYDESLVPVGYTEDDIKIYFFDTERGRWVALDGIEVNKNGNWLRADTDHFTDFIAGVVVAPDAPQTANFNPTQIQGIKAADPTAKINLVEAPSANNMGDAGLNYPIELPAGRLGLAPSLSVAYNSSAQNGWMGLGWNLSVPEISIDTRWGVPRYDAAFETETYSFNGQMLTPVAHRAALVGRETDREFHTRVEGGFQKIIRHGSHPSNYWFEVVDKMGTRYAYGGNLDSGAIDVSAALLTDTGNVFRWKLTEVRDTNGNFVKYDYGKVASTGLKQGANLGKNIYVERISYTGHNGSEGAYEVLFTRDRELPGFAERKDTTIDGRGGFKQVTADLLRHIEVRLDGTPVRAYEFTYAVGAYYKTLLQTITQYGADGTAFNTHSFEYHDDTREADGSYKGFAPKVTWDGLGSDVRATAIGGAQTDGSGGSFGIGLSLLAPSAEYAPLTIKADFAASNSKTETTLALIDISGDGLPDKVFLSGSNVMFRKNLSGSAGQGDLEFSQPIAVANLNKIGEQKTNSSTRALTANFSGFNLGITWTDSTTESGVYFADVNGDGLLDLVNNGSVLFSHIDASGNPVFTADSFDTPYPIPDSAVAADVVNVDMSAALEAMLAGAPLVDTVYLWEAPFDGVVDVASDVALMQDTSAERAAYETADGVKVSIQQNASVLWSTDIAADDYAPKSANIGALSVAKGDKLFFRVQSQFDGAYDAVEWAPVINYAGVDLAQKDSNDLPVYSYDYTEDFTLFGFGNGPVPAPADGTAQITGGIAKTAITTDDVTVEVLKGSTVLTSHTFLAGETGTYSFDETVALLGDEFVYVYEYNDPSDPSKITGVESVTKVQDADLISVRLHNDSRIDASALQWDVNNPPVATYVAFDDPDTPVLDDDGNPTTALNLFGTVALLSGSNFDAPATTWTVPQTGTYTVTPEILLNAGAADGSVVLTLKSDLARLFKAEYNVTNGALVASPFEIELTAGQQIWIEFTDGLAAYSADLIEARVDLKLPNLDYPNTAPQYFVDEVKVVEVHSPRFVSTLGEAHRGWARIGYKPEDPALPLDISDSDLEGMDTAAIEAVGADVEATVTAADQSGSSDQNFDESQMDAVDTSLVSAEPVYAADRWIVQEEETYFASTGMASSRMNNNFPSVPDPAGFAGARAVAKVSVSDTNGFSIGYVPFSASKSSTDTRSIIDFMDLNGDGFPDILKEGTTVQYTRMLGFLDTVVSQPANMNAAPREARGNSFSIGVGSSPISVTGDAKGRFAARPGSNTPSDVPSKSFASIGFSLGYSDSDTYQDYDLMDVNGDGLPDLVKDDAGCGLLKVRFNIGYGYLSQDETLGEACLMKGTNSRVGGGINASFGTLIQPIGFNAGQNSLSFGSDAGASDNVTQHALADVNGDGLLDSVAVGTNNVLYVKLNSGSGFEPTLSWPTGGNGVHFAKSSGLDSGLGATGTLYIPIIPILPVLWLDISAGVNTSEAISFTEASISDVNGDGDPDLLRSSSDNELYASFGQDIRTNMLRQVNRPLGSTIAMDYTVSGNTYEQPSNRWVMNRVEVFDGHAGDGADTLVTTISYENGQYDRQEREFYGFETVTENHLNYVSAGNESVYRTIENTYKNDSYYGKGLLLSSVTRDAQGNRYLETNNLYAFRDIHADATGDVASLTATIFPQLVRTNKAFYEGQSTAGKSTYQTFAYDELGNVTRFFDAANLDTTSDDVESLIAYHSDLPNYIVGKANRVVVNGNGDEMRRRHATFEAGTGNLLDVSSFDADGTVSLTSLSYDSYGNLLEVQGAENANGQRYALNYTFDPVVQTYVTNTVDSFGYTSSAEYDFRFGEVVSTTDINAQNISNTLDEFGRVVTITGPYQDTDATITFAYNPKVDVPNAPVTYPVVDLSWALTQHIDTYRDAQDPIETVLFADGLGRVLQTKKDAAIYANDAYTDMMVASGRITFDHVGRQIEQYYPVEEPLGQQSVFNPTYDLVDPTVTTYDILDRPLTITIPDGSSTTMVYDFGADRDGLTQFRTHFTDAEGKQRETYADVRGLMTSVKEMNPAGGQPTIWTSYVYDPLKQITLVTDDQGNETTSEYDNLGRQIAINSPDLGLTEFAYDPASNLVAKQTANLRAAGQDITYQYDFNRLMGVTYPEFTDNNVVYTYGAPGAPDNRANRIVTVQSQAGLEERFYGPLGETVKTIFTVASDTQGNSANSPEIYTTEYTYDTWNRLQSMVYPDGEILVNSYDSGGKLIAIDGAKAGFDYSYLKEMGYDKFGQRVFLRLGNDTTTSYTYTDDTRRLDTLQTYSQQTGRTFQDMTYGYDLVGNILSQANLAENTENSLLGGATSYSYEYDDLYRLIGATGSWSAPNNPESFTLTMSYDTIHNIASKTQEHLVVDRVQGKTSYDWTYGYNGAQPHAPTDIGDRTFSYDANGNQTGWEHNQNGTRRTIVWDEENRIQSISDNGATTTYKYNDAGERIFKVGAQGETVYVNQFYVIRGGQVATKHVFGGSQRLVTKLASQPVFEDTTTSATDAALTDPVADVTATNGNGKGGGNTNAHGNNPNAGGVNGAANGQGSGAGGVNGGGTSGGDTGGAGGTTGPQEERTFYFYHPDHLGSSSYVTDIDGLVFQHVEYFPFGETWVEEHSNRQRTPYLFTGKELDEDVQLYYFGARYYDPRTSVWQSPDPILAEYLQRDDADQNSVFQPSVLNLYGYVSNSPIQWNDPTGKEKADSWRQAETRAMSRLRREGHTILNAQSRVTATREGYPFGRRFDIVSTRNGVYYLTEVKFSENEERQRSNARKIWRKINPLRKIQALGEIGRAGTVMAQLYHDGLDTDIELSGRNITPGDADALSEAEGDVVIRWELWSNTKDERIVNLTLLKTIADPEEREQMKDDFVNGLMEDLSVQ